MLTLKLPLFIQPLDEPEWPIYYGVSHLSYYVGIDYY